MVSERVGELDRARELRMGRARKALFVVPSPFTFGDAVSRDEMSASEGRNKKERRREKPGAH